MQKVIAAVNLLYFLSLVVTAVWYPEGPVYSDHSEEPVAYNRGLTKFHVFMFIPFGVVTKWAYDKTTVALGLGIKPGYVLDILGVNLLAQTLYCFTSKGLWLYWAIPAYAAYKVISLIRQFCC